MPVSIRAISVLRRKIVCTIIQYFMLEIHDSVGRLFVVLSMRVRHVGKLACVFIDGRKVAEFVSMGEAVSHARSLAEGACVEVPGAAPTFDEE